MEDKDVLMTELKPVIAYTIGTAVLDLIEEGRPVTKLTIAEMVVELSGEEPDITDELALDALKG